MTDRYVTDLRDVPTHELERELDLRRYPYYCKTHRCFTVNHVLCTLIVNGFPKAAQCDVTKRRTQ